MPPWKWVPQFSPYPQLKCLMKHSTFYSSLPSRRWQNLSLQELGNKINMMALTADWTAPWITLQRNATNGAWLLVRGLVKRPGKARPNRLSNSTLEFHQTTYQKPYPIPIWLPCWRHASRAPRFKPCIRLILQIALIITEYDGSLRSEARPIPHCCRHI